MVDESPFPRSLQHVVEIILEPAVPRVPAAALRAVGQRLPQQAEPSALLPLHSHRTCSSRQHRVVHGRPARLHIFQRVFLPPASRCGLQPQPGAAALVAAVTSRHGITSAGRWKPGRHSHVAKYYFVEGYLITLTLTCSQIRESNGWGVKFDLLWSDHFSSVYVRAVPVWRLWPSAQGWERAGLWRSRSIEAFVEGRALSHPPTRFLPSTLAVLP